MRKVAIVRWTLGFLFSLGLILSGLMHEPEVSGLVGPDPVWKLVVGFISAIGILVLVATSKWEVLDRPMYWGGQSEDHTGGRRVRRPVTSEEYKEYLVRKNSLDK